jgi:beta-galactosidase
VPTEQLAEVSYAGLTPLRLTLMRSKGISLVGQQFSVSFDKKSARMSSFKYKGKELLKSGPYANFMRVPTDNDEGGGDKSYAARWRASGLDSLRLMGSDLRVEKVNAHVYKVTLIKSLQGKAGGILVSSLYTVYATGDVQLLTTFTPNGTWPPFAKVGLQFEMALSYDRVKWYGRGPYETYADRKSSANVGLYAGTVDEQHFPYIMAQENGNKTDVRWLAVTNADGLGLLAISDSLMNVSVHNYTDAALLAAKTPGVPLAKDSATVVNIDLAQMGLGGDDSWNPRVHEPYQLPAKTYGYSFRLRPIDQADDIAKLTHSTLPIFAKGMSPGVGVETTIEEDGEEEAAVKKAPTRYYPKKKTYTKRRR